MFRVSFLQSIPWLQCIYMYICVYKSAHRSYRKKVSQQRFHEHYGQHCHNGIDDWQFTLIEQCETHEQLKERETFWQHRLKTFYPYGLNEKKEYLY